MGGGDGTKDTFVLSCLSTGDLVAGQVIQSWTESLHRVGLTVLDRRIAFVPCKRL